MHKQTIPLAASADKCDCSVECFEDTDKSINRFNVLRPALKKEHSINITIDRCVHFADSHGLELVNICRFKDSSDSVNKLDVDSPSSPMFYQNTNPYSYQTTVPILENTNVLTCPWIVCFSDLKFDDNMKYLIKTNGVKLRLFQLNYSTAVSKWFFEGLIDVYNYAFHKRVIIRLTKNDWASFEDYPCIWSSHDVHQNIDSFKFNFELPSLKAINEHRIEFCIKYLYSQKEFTYQKPINYHIESQFDDDQITILWDNNNGSNYKIVR